jgi:hypothetical protein
MSSSLVATHSASRSADSYEFAFGTRGAVNRPSGLVDKPRSGGTNIRDVWTSEGSADGGPEGCARDEAHSAEQNARKGPGASRRVRRDSAEYIRVLDHVIVAGGRYHQLCGTWPSLTSEVTIHRFTA